MLLLHVGQLRSYYCGKGHTSEQVDWMGPCLLKRRGVQRRQRILPERKFCTKAFASWQYPHHLGEVFFAVPVTAHVRHLHLSG